MMDLTVEIDGVIGTMEDALRRYTGTEILNGENKYKCGRCKSYEKAKKKLTIIEAPNILTIALKRFQVLSGLEILSAQPTGKLQPTVTVHNKSDSLQSPIDITNEKLVHSMMVS